MNDILETVEGIEKQVDSLMDRLKNRDNQIEELKNVIKMSAVRIEALTVAYGSSFSADVKSDNIRLIKKLKAMYE